MARNCSAADRGPAKGRLSKMLRSPGARLLIAASICAAALYEQGGGSVSFRDWTAPAATGKPGISCGELRGLTSYEYSVVSATLIRAPGDVPAHCRVSILVPPTLNVEVNLPTAWNSRLYMFGNGGFGGESFEAANRIETRANALKYGFAVSATDTGHSTESEPGASFAT